MLLELMSHHNEISPGDLLYVILVHVSREARCDTADNPIHQISRYPVYKFSYKTYFAVHLIVIYKVENFILSLNN